MVVRRRVLSVAMLASMTAIVGGPVFADFTPTIDGSTSEWGAKPAYLDPNETAEPDPRDVQHVWIADNNTSGSNGYLFIALDFYSMIKDPSSPASLDTIQISFDTNRDGITDYVAKIDRASGTFRLYSGTGTLLHSYVYGTDYKDTNGRSVELRIPYADLGLTYGADRFDFVVQTDPGTTKADRAPNSGTLYYNGPAANGAGTVVAATAAQVGVVSATVAAGGGGVEVAWQVGAEVDNIGFLVTRWDARRGEWREVARRAGRGTTGLGAEYSVSDGDGVVGDLYAVADVDVAGRMEVRGAAIAAAVRWGAAVGERPWGAVRWGAGFGERYRGTGARAGVRGAWYRPPRPGGGGGSMGGVEIAVAAGGLVRVAAADLAAAGATWAPPAAPHLTFFGRSVPAWSNAAGDLLFYAPSPAAPSRAEDVYVLAAAGHGWSPWRGVLAPTRAQLAAAPSSFADTRHVEEEHVYQPAGPDEDPFTWTYVTTDAPFTTAIDLPGLAAGTRTVTLDVRLRGSWDDPARAPDHHAVLQVDGVPAGEAWFDGTNAAEIVATVSASAASLTLVAPGDTGISWEAFELDAIDVTYGRDKVVTRGSLAVTSLSSDAVPVTGLLATPAILDITDPTAAVLLAGGSSGGGAAAFVEKPGAFPRAVSRRYLFVARGSEQTPAWVAPAGATPDDLAAQVAGADYVIITHADLRAAADALAAHRAASGLRPAVVDVDDVADAYAGGNHGPEGLYAFLGELAASPAPPRFVVLFGAASVDPRAYLEAQGPDYVPSAPLREPERGLIAWSDEQYVADPAGLPAMALGRIPARSPAAAQAYVDKIIAYDAQLAAEGPAGRSLLVADAAGAEDLRFDEAVAQYATTIGPAATSLSVADGVAAARAGLLAGFDAGQDVIAFAGHGNPLWWSKSRILSIDDTLTLGDDTLTLGDDTLRLGDDAPALHGPRAAFVLSSACYDGMHTHPDHDPLAWALVAGPTGVHAGAIAALASTTLSSPSVSTTFDLLVLRAAYGGDATTWGEAARAARIGLAGLEPADAAHLSAIAYLGDPALAVPLPLPASAE